jgi:hypothetical protein
MRHHVTKGKQRRLIGKGVLFYITVNLSIKNNKRNDGSQQ